MRIILIKMYLFLFSRPTFFKVFYYINKLGFYAMNRVSAALMEAEYTGEKYAAIWIFKKLKHKEQLVIFDCGANVGSYANMILNVSGSFGNKVSIYLFEPSKLCFEVLNRNFGSFKNVFINQIGVSNKNGLDDLYYPWEGAAGASLSSSISDIQKINNFSPLSEQVKITTIDDFCKEHKIDVIDFLKLDVEGYEKLALEGAEKMLLEGKIRFIQIEIGLSSLVTKNMLFDIWKMLGDSYNFYLILNRGIIQIQYKPDLECFLGASNFILELKK